MRATTTLPTAHYRLHQTRHPLGRYGDFFVIRRIVAVAAALLTVLTLSPPAGAAPPNEGAPQVVADKGPGKSGRFVGSESLSAADLARQRAQKPLLDLNNRVYDLTARSYDAHFAGAHLDVQKNTLILYWAGKVPGELLGLRTKATKSGITLTIKPARFSKKQLMATADAIMKTAEMAGTVELAVDGSGLTIAAGNLPAVARGARSATAAESRLLQRIAATRRLTGVPITVAAAPPPAEFDDTRHRDQDPFWAGAMISMQGSTCTSGFSMYAAAAPRTRFTLTAAHCPDFTDGVAIANGAGDAMGRSDFIHELYDNNTTAYDLGVVRLNPGLRNEPYIFVGEDSSAGRIPVSGYASAGIPSGGNYCVHGMREINCNLLSGATIGQCSDWPPEGRCVYTITMSTWDNDSLIWCRGDSGGPIYYWSGNSVIASGVVSWSIHDRGDCSTYGGASVVATAVNSIAGLRVVTTSAP